MTDSNGSETDGNGTEHQIGNPTGFGTSGPPTFDTEKVVDWTCPECGEDGYHRRGLADYYVVCPTQDCAVKLFCAFRDVDTDTKQD